MCVLAFLIGRKYANYLSKLLISFYSLLFADFSCGEFRASLLSRGNSRVLGWSFICHFAYENNKGEFLQHVISIIAIKY